MMHPMVTFISDDGKHEDWTVLKPAFENAGAPCVIAVTSGLIGSPGYMNDEQIGFLQNSLGWEVTSHLDSHVALTELSEQEIDRQFRVSKDKLQALGYRVTSVVYPYGANNAVVREIARKYYQSGFQSVGGINAKRVKRYHINRVAIGSYFDFGNDVDTGSFTYYKARVDEALHSRAWLVFMIHPAASEHDDKQQQALIETLDYIRSRKIPIVTVEQGLRSLADGTGKITIDRDTWLRKIADKLRHRLKLIYFFIANDS
ncbi:polysaccharide deacetylase family protein [Cohnella yongneupensis]|uniref:Polysaccharide deacetylase family protein n=1 Tax=Cohnella yongneupensis TaxID=425006 RepID=A0ABW0R3F9_9BACL